MEEVDSRPVGPDQEVTVELEQVKGRGAKGRGGKGRAEGVGDGPGADGEGQSWRRRAVVRGGGGGHTGIRSVAEEMKRQALVGKKVSTKRSSDHDCRMSDVLGSRGHVVGLSF